jgi:ribose/xylose/arabinose/galactoside ABC-type transport system permease subunit
MTAINAPGVSLHPSQARNWLDSLRKTIVSQEGILALSLLVMIAVVGLAEPRFREPRNIANILHGNAYIAVAAIGMSLVIISGNIDISVGSLIGVLAVISGQLAISGFPIWVAWLVPLIAGGMVGAVNGFLVGYLRIPSIVVTLGMLSILKGGLISVTRGEWIKDLPEGYFLAQLRPLEGLGSQLKEAGGALGGIGVFLERLPMPVYFMVFMVIIAALWMRYSPTGRAIYAVGGNAEAARLSGLSDRGIILRVFIINGVIVGIASVLFATQLSIIQSTVPAGIELLIITSAVVGGVSILGGTGTVIGAMLAAILLSAIGSALIFIDVSPYWLKAVQGILILLTVLADIVRRRRQLRRISG